MRFAGVFRSQIPAKRVLAIAFLAAAALATLLSIGKGGSAGAQHNGAPSAWIDFDIPAQPLAAALNAYGAATHVQLFVDSSVTSGRRSTALHGAFTPEAGLLSLISGTGLTARPVGDQGITLIPLDGCRPARRRVVGRCRRVHSDRRSGLQATRRGYSAT
jgi:hypothetical protein